jgi:ABC-type bacteriocin/lantibiotic exporter with double-glycine peptidase domain
MADAPPAPPEPEGYPVVEAPPAPPPPELLPLPAHAPLMLHEPGRRWIVAAGEVTLFILRPASGPAGEGARRYLGTVPAGGMICGIGTDDAGATPIAVGTAETRLTPLDPAVLLAEEGGARRLADGIQAWTRALAEGIARPMLPRPRADVAVSEGLQPLRPGPGATLAARGRPVWARLTGGSFLLFGLERVSGLVPLPAEAWLTGGGGTVEPVGAEQAVLDAGWEAGLEAFNAACLGAMPAALALDAADEINRLRLRSARDAEAEADRAASFGAILGTETAEAEVGDGDPLMPVFRLVAAEFGLRAKRPVRVRRLDVDAVSTLEELARATGLRLRPVRLENAWWTEDQGPLLGRLKDGTPVALLRRRGRYLLHVAGARPRPVDPGLAELVAPLAQAPVLPLPAKKLTMMDLLTAGMGGSGADVTTLVVLLLLGAALGQAVPLATGVAFSLLIPGGHLSELAQLGAALALVAGVSWIAKIGGEIARARVEARAGPALHAAIWDRVLRFPLSVFTKQTVGETSARATAAVNIAMQLRAFGFVLATAIATILSSLAMMLVAQPVPALIALGLLLIQVAVANLFGWLQARAFATGEALSGLADAMVFQIVSGLVKLRLAGAEARAQGVWATRFAEMRRRMTAARSIGNAYDAFAAGFAVISTAAAFWMIATLQRVEPGEVPPSLAAVMTFISAYGLMVAAGTQLARAMFGLWFLLPSVKFAKPLMEQLPETDSGRVDPGRLSGAIELSNLTFRYPGAEAPVFAGLTLRIDAGEFVAIVGRSGAGKSTLVRLLLGLEEPVSGAIYLDGQDLRSLDLAVLRRQVATVLQAGRVPPGSIRDAVRGLTEADDREVWGALDRAALGADVRAMPMGLETMLTDAGRVLSGGQVQRLLLARAFLQKPAIMIMDEATSALDNVTQRATMRAVRGMPATRIVIAHRLSTIRHADRIIVLDAGRIAEMGSFDQLLARKGGIFHRQYAEEARWQAGKAG